MDLPRDRLPDATVSILREGYTFISRRCDRHGTDAFLTRLMGQPVVCCRGREAARLVYDLERVTREGAMPAHVLRLLQGKGSVETLSGEEHRHRKRLFLDILGPGRFGDLLERIVDEWRLAVDDWQRRRSVNVLDEAGIVFVRATCGWAGIPLETGDTRTPTPRQVAHWFATMLDTTNKVGFGQVTGQLERRRADAWGRRLVAEARERPRAANDATVLEAIARHRLPDGTLLPERVAAFELFNLLRPTFAVARFVTFALMALHEHPAWRARLAERPDDARLFVHEVRRLSPFFPFIGGITRMEAHLCGARLEPGTWILLDIYGTNRHPAIWEEPLAFDPGRFDGRPDDPDGFIPQGGGDHATGHRCAGEWLTIEAMVAIVRLMTSDVRWGVPQQDLTVRLDRIPAGPESGFVIAEVERVGRTALAAASP